MDAFYLLVNFLVLGLFQAGLSQFLPVTCDPNGLYNYGTCRANTCPLNESFVPGKSYCESYGTLFYPPRLTRCAPSAPCCIWGGVCRVTCPRGQHALAFPSDCNDQPASSCCLPSRAFPDCGNFSLPTSGRQSQYGGDTSSNPQWPWVVRLLYRLPEVGRRVCAGVLVDDDTVLTVAQCVAGRSANDLQVRVGDYDVSASDPEEILVSVRSSEVGSNYVIGRRGSDLAVLKLSEPVLRSKTRWPICLPHRTAGRVDPRLADAGIVLTSFHYDQCYVAGWTLAGNGQVNRRLRTTRARLLNRTACRDVVADRELRGGVRQAPVSDDVICVEHSVNGQDGAPFLLSGGGATLACRDETNRFVLVGLSSQTPVTAAATGGVGVGVGGGVGVGVGSGVGGGVGGVPVFFTRIESFLRAIQSRLS